MGKLSMKALPLSSGKVPIPLEGGDEGDVVEDDRFPIVDNGSLWPHLGKM